MTDPAPDTQQIEMLKTLLHDSRTERTRLADEVDRLRALADPAPVGLTEDEALILDEARNLAPPDPDHPIPWDRYLLSRLLAIIDRLSAAPVDDRERVPEDEHPEQSMPEGWSIVALVQNGDRMKLYCVPAAQYEEVLASDRPWGPIHESELQKTLGERVPEGWRVEWRTEELHGPGEGPREIPYLVQIPMVVSPSVDPEEG